MKKHFLTISFVLLTILSFGQAPKYTLTGKIEMNTGEVFPYKIVFTESGGIIKGHSYTYKEPDDTKAAITGSLDKHDRKLSFKETEIIYSHSIHTKAFMCLIDANTDYVQSAKGKMFKGPITSKEADHTACTGGIVTFDNPEEIKNIFDTHEKFDTVITMGRRPKEPVIEKAQPAAQPEKELVTEKITNGVEKALDWHSDTVIIDVWDGGTVDGDKVTLKYNGKPLLEQYSLVKQKKQLRIPISGHGIDVITILADNEGWDPPNTANLLLTDGAVKYSILSYNTKGQISMIKIKKAAK